VTPSDWQTEAIAMELRERSITQQYIQRISNSSILMDRDILNTCFKANNNEVGKNARSIIITPNCKIRGTTN
jgi:hypothetical protein